MRQFRAEREGKKKWICTNDDAARANLSQKHVEKYKEFFEFFELRVGECVSLFVMELIKP